MTSARRGRMRSAMESSVAAPIMCAKDAPNSATADINAEPVRA
jgi:hypothetical protein